MVQATYVWHTTPGHEHCNACLGLEGHVFVIDAENIPQFLDANGMTVYDCSSDASIVHEVVGIKHPCYCRLELIATDFSDLGKEIHDLTVIIASRLEMLSGGSV